MSGGGGDSRSKTSKEAAQAGVPVPAPHSAAGKRDSATSNGDALLRALDMVGEAAALFDADDRFIFFNQT